MLRVDLRRLIMALCLFSTLLAVATVMLASYVVQRDQLISTALENNRVYAVKLAKLTDTLLTESQNTLRHFALTAGAHTYTAEEREDLITSARNQTSHFNSMVWLGADNTVLAESPANLGLVGQVVDTEQSRRAVASRQAFISAPFRASTGRWVLSQVSPVFTSDGRYAGYVAGNLYLHEKNDLHSLLSEHYFKDGSYTYVVDRQGRIIFHPNNAVVGHTTEHEQIAALMRNGKLSDQALKLDIDPVMLAGFASIDASGWGVVVMRSRADVLFRLNELTVRTLYTAAPLIVLSLILVGWLATRITRPLRTLASLAHTMDHPQTTTRLQQAPDWFVEAAQLKHALLTGLWAINHKIRNLRHESATDMLSGLLNRRGLRAALDELNANQTPTAIIVLDIDHFKRVNDTLGHDGGDAIIRMMAERMRRTCRAGDITARTGGEEFVMLLPETTAAEAWHIAEQLRRDIHETPTTSAMPITVSCGIAQSPTNARDLDQAWQLADKALYRAKRSGRDCSFVAEQTPEDDARHTRGRMT